MPIALLVIAGRVLNPALVIVEVVINLYALFWNRRAARAVLGRVLPLAAGLVPGVVVGALLLGHIAPASVKLGAYLALLPLILLQAAGQAAADPEREARRVPLGAGRRLALRPDDDLGPAARAVLEQPGPREGAIR